MSVLVSRGNRVVKSFGTCSARAGRTYGLALGVGHLSKRTYQVVLQAARGTHRICVILASRRI